MRSISRGKVYIGTFKPVFFDLAPIVNDVLLFDLEIRAVWPRHDRARTHSDVFGGGARLVYDNAGSPLARRRRLVVGDVMTPRAALALCPARRRGTGNRPCESVLALLTGVIPCWSSINTTSAPRQSAIGRAVFEGAG